MLLPGHDQTTSLLETSRAGRAGERQTVKRAPLVDDSADVLRTDRLNRTLDLVDVLTKVTVQVAVVIPEVGPLQFAHRKLRSEPEGSLTSVRLGDEALERFASDDEHDLVRSTHPSRVTALSEAVVHGLADDRVDQNEVAASVEASRPERLLVNAEGEAPVAHELVASNALFAEAERTSGQTDQVFLDIGVIAEVLDLIRARHDLEELPVTGSERFSEHLFAQEAADLVERLEVHRGIGKNCRELRTERLHVTREVLCERLSAVGDKLDARQNQVLVPNVSVDDLKDGLLQRDLSLQITALECRASLLDADTGTSTAKGLELEAVLGAANEVRVSANATQGGVIDENGGRERGRRNSHFLDNGTNNVRDVRKRSTIDGVNIGRLPGENPANLTNDTVNVFGGEVLNCRQWNAIRHNFSFSWLSLVLVSSLLKPPQEKNRGDSKSVFFPRVQEVAFLVAPGTLVHCFRPILQCLVTTAGRCYNGSSIPIYGQTIWRLGFRQ